MPWSEILGHRDVVERFRGSVACGRLSHTYAFVGPHGVGKRRFAIELAKCLVCERHDEADLEACGECPACRQVTALSHPDLYLVGLLPKKSELLISQFLGEDDKRGREGLCYELSRHPMSARRKVAIIDDADCLNEESGNALLKTLEEPPAHSLLILIASSKDVLLPTIQSRCQIVTFAPLADEHLEKLLIGQQIVPGAAEAAEISRLADGSLETARLLVDPQLRGQRTVLYDMLSARPYRSAPLAAAMIAGLDSDSETSTPRISAGWMVRFAIEFFRQSLLCLARGERESRVPQVTRFIEQFPEESCDALDRVGDLLERCIVADRQLESNAVVPLCLETLFNDLAEPMRAVAVAR
jgi:DNA polymerase III subunit delta'